MFLLNFLFNSKDKTVLHSGGKLFVITVVSGKLRSRTRNFYLNDSFTIGSSLECDIIFENVDVSPKNTKIYMENNEIYIVDLDSKNGTSLGGMRIFAANKLCSGDVISINNVSFYFEF